MEKIRKIYSRVGMIDKILSLILIILFVFTIIFVAIRFIREGDYNQLFTDIVSMILYLLFGIVFLANVIAYANIDNMVSERLEEIKK